MKTEIGGEALGGRRVDAALRIADEKTGDGGIAIFVENAESDRQGGLSGEENIHLIAEADVLRALSDVEHELGFTLSCVAAIDL